MDKIVTFQVVCLEQKKTLPKKKNVMDKIVTFQYVCLAQKAHSQKTCHG